jgi:hypothetical protein
MGSGTPVAVIQVMTAPIVNASSIPLTGNAVVTQGCESDSPQSAANAAAAAAQSPADSAKSLSRPGFFLLDIRAQSPPGATTEPTGDASNGTALPTGGNFLPLLLQSLWRQQPDPATFPPSLDSQAAPSVAASASDLPSVQVPGTVPANGLASVELPATVPANGLASVELPATVPANDLASVEVTGSATPPNPAAAKAATIFEPALQTARKVLELLRSQVQAGASDLASAKCAPPPVPAADPAANPAANPATAAVALPAALVAQAVQIAPDMLAALIKRVTQSATSSDAPPAQPDATAALPLVQASSNDAKSADSTADAIKQLIDSLPKHTPVDQVLSSTSEVAGDARTAKAAADALTAPFFVDAHALRAHGATAPPADAAAQTLRLDAPIRSPAWGRELGERITWLVDQNLSTAQIKLNPPQLGPIEVHIALSGDSTQVSVTAHNMITRDALEAAAPRLREALSAHGLGNVSVDISQQSFTDRGLPQSRANAFEPWQALSSQVTASLASATQRLRLPGRLDAYA